MKPHVYLYNIIAIIVIYLPILILSLLNLNKWVLYYIASSQLLILVHEVIRINYLWNKKIKKKYFFLNFTALIIFIMFVLLIEYVINILSKIKIVNFNNWFDSLFYKTIIVKIRHNGNNYEAIIENVGGIVVVTHKTLKGIKKEIRESLDLHIQECIDDNEEEILPEFIRNKKYKIKFKVIK